MGAPRLLVEAASSYSGDLEDRHTELLAVALNEHPAFLDRLVKELDLKAIYARADIATQTSYLSETGQRCRIDLEIRLMSRGEKQAAVIFIECKYNPDGRRNHHWFVDPYGMAQGPVQKAVLDQERGSVEKVLASIVSDCDLRRIDFPKEYELSKRLGWKKIADLINEAGGEPGWQRAARAANAVASQRVLLEVWSYLKGDAVGALDDTDLQALSGAARMEERVEALLRRISEMRGWDQYQQPGKDWGSAATWLRYITAPVVDSPWPGGEAPAFYVVITGRPWDVLDAVGNPQMYAGFGADWGNGLRGEDVDQARWQQQIGRQLKAVVDADGCFVFGARSLSELLGSGRTLSDQAGQSLRWIEEALMAAREAPPPVFG